MGFGTNLNNKPQTITPPGHFNKKGRVCLSPVVASIFPLEKKGCRRRDEEPASSWNSSAEFPERSRLILPDQADYQVFLPGEGSSCHKPKEEARAPSPHEKLLRAETRKAKATTEIPLTASLLGLHFHHYRDATSSNFYQFNN